MYSTNKQCQKGIQKNNSVRLPLFRLTSHKFSCASKVAATISSVVDQWGRGRGGRSMDRGNDVHLGDGAEVNPPIGRNDAARNHN